MSTRREITRAATVAEIKETALRFMREQGSTDVRFADIARAMSMTGPALYRYFSGRDELLTELLTDAFTSLADALEKALADSSEQDPAAPFWAVSRAYRSWALEDPTRYALVFGLQVAGYQAPEEGAHHVAGQRAFDCMIRTVLAAIDAGAEVKPLGPLVTPSLDSALAVKSEGLDPRLMQAMLHPWAGIHGFVGLETFGHFSWCVGTASDDLFDGLIHGLATYIGLTTAPPAV